MGKVLGISLAGRHVLVVEDEYFVADDLVRELQHAGAVVVGPVSSAAGALALVEKTQPEIAVLDINLKGKISFDLADLLDARGTPFIFATGYDQHTIPSRHAGRIVVQKPATAADIVAALTREASA